MKSATTPSAPTSHRVGSEPEFLLDRWLEDLDDLVPKHQRYVTIAREVAEAEGVVLCDLATTMDELPLDRVRSFFNDDGIHFTPAGGKAVGTMLYRCLREHGLLPEG